MGKNIVISVLLVIVLCLSGYLVYDKVIDKKENTNPVVENGNTEVKSDSDLKYKIVKDWNKITDETTCSGEYNETFNSINVKITYSGCIFDDFRNEIRVNGEKVELSSSLLRDFAFYGNYLIFSSTSTSGVWLDIYDTINKDSIYSSTSFGYLNGGYTIEDDKIVFTGVEGGDMFPFIQSSGYKYSKFEFRYENGKLSDPILVDRWN